MEDIVKSIKAFLYDRTASPLFGAFVVSWLAWNYRVIMVAFDGDAKLPEKMEFLDSYFADGHQFQIFGYPFHFLGGGYLVHGFLMPALLTAFYIYGYPKLAKPIYQHSLRKRQELREIKQAEENARVLTVEESRKLQKEIEQLRKNYDEDTERYQSRIRSLTETINDLEGRLGEAQSSPEVKLVDKEPSLKGKAVEETDADTRIALHDAIAKLYMRPNDQLDNESQARLNELIEMVGAYCADKQLTVDEVLVLVVLVRSDGLVDLQSLSGQLLHGMSQIEMNNSMAKLRQKNIAYTTAEDQLALTEVGNELVVDAGLTKLDKEFRRAPPGKKWL